jgi:hypothetical protein
MNKLSEKIVDAAAKALIATVIAGAAAVFIEAVVSATVDALIEKEKK